MSSKIEWTNDINDVEFGALYVMTNRGEWCVDIIPKQACFGDESDRMKFIGHPDTLYYGPIPWPAPDWKRWPDNGTLTIG